MCGYHEKMEFISDLIKLVWHVVNQPLQKQKEKSVRLAVTVNAFNSFVECGYAGCCGRMYLVPVFKGSPDCSSRNVEITD